MQRGILLSIILLLFNLAQGQKNITAWYANGQAWIVFDLDIVGPISNKDPRSYSLYASDKPFNSITQADIQARLFIQELVPSALRSQFNLPELTFKIPDGKGGLYTLGANEGLFVITVHRSELKYFGVIKDGGTKFSTGTNITNAPVELRYSLSESPQCYPQISQILSTGHSATAYYLWADGRKDWWKGRPDFPIMANKFKNGMPSLFIVSEGLDISERPSERSITHWLHGGGGTAAQSLPGQKSSINIIPKSGYLVAHNDDFFRYVNGQLTTFESNSNFFGWSKDRNPFDKTWKGPISGDTIVNYTQRRILWINDWLVATKNVNPYRISLQGHSMGSGGVAALARAFPNRFSLATLFNNGMTFGEEETFNQRIDLMGSPRINAPTNLLNRSNKTVTSTDLFHASKSIAQERDMCIMQVWHGKNDNNPTMKWDEEVVEGFLEADASGMGWKIFWDERGHGLNALETHWSHGPSDSQQTQKDNVAFHQKFFSNQSFPAFFNHQFDVRNNKLGIGQIGVGHDDGDDWGTWGGYHEWDIDQIVDEPEVWEATVWLNGEAYYKYDICPFAALTSDIAIRKPQNFRPVKGTTLEWNLVDDRFGTVLYQGMVDVEEDDLVVIPEVTIFREDIRKTRLIVKIAETTSVHNTKPSVSWSFYPNPTRDVINIKINQLLNEEVEVTILNPLGQPLIQRNSSFNSNEVTVPVNTLDPGIYVVRIQNQNFQEARTFMVNR